MTVYFLFNHIINVADALDLELLQDITSALRSLGEGNMAINSVYRLCVSLTDMYTNFTEQIIQVHSDNHNAAAISTRRDRCKPRTSQARPWSAAQQSRPQPFTPLSSNYDLRDDIINRDLNATRV
jgi:hypothetical protein